MNEIDVQYATEKSPTMPSEEQISTWVNNALSLHDSEGGLTVRITNEAEITELNRDYREKDKPTNVLSFPMDLPADLPMGLPTELAEEIGVSMLGDIVICASIVEKEATEQNKSSQSHWAHMVIHGTLHLLGYDHIDDKEAEEMESLEIEIMHKLGYKDPYQQMEDS